MLLTELLTPDRVVVPLTARDKAGIIAELTRVLVGRGDSEYAEVLAAVRERETVLSTGIGNGVAIPHARSAAVRALSLACGVAPTPVPFDAIDGEPVGLVFLIVGPEGSAGEHVKLLSRIASLVRRDAVRERLAAARTPEEFYRVLVETEEG